MTLTRPRLSAFVLIPMAAAIVVAAIVPGNAEFVQQGADQGFTYGYLPTLVLHHDLDFSRAALPFDSSMPHTVTGRSHNAFPMGPSIWWTPAFVGAYGATAAVNAIRPGHPIANDGRSRAYDMLVGLASMALAIVGLWAVLRITRRFAPPVPATLATIGIWLAGPLVYYANEAPLQSHVAGFTSSALLVLLWLRYRDRTDMTLSRVALLGILGGFVALSRWQDLVILIGPGVDVLIGRLRRRRGPDLPGAGAFGLGVVVGVLPQLAVWNGLYGSPFRPPRGEAAGGFLNLARLEVSGVLFSWWHGLFSWHPLLALAVVGLVLGLRHHRMVCGSLLAALAVMVLVNAGVLDWWAGAAFGGRRFDGLWPGLAIGLAIIFAKMPRVLTIALTAAAAGWNWLLLCAFTGGTIPTNAAVTPAALVRAVPKTSLLPSIDSWSIDKAVWVAGIAGLAAVPWIRGRIARRRARALPRAGSSRSIRPDAMAVLALTSASLLVSAGIAAAAIEKPGPYNAHLFEAAFFVPQWQRPARTDRVVAPGEEVWTLIWSFPGFLQPGEYRAVVTGLGGTGPGTRLMVLVDGKTVFDSATNQPTASGPPFRVAQGFHRVDLRAEGGPTHLDAVHIEAAG